MRIGAFTAADTAATAAALAIFAAGLPAFVLIKVFSPAYFAREDTKTPMMFAGISLTLNTVASAVLFFAFREAGWMPHLGIAVASVFGGWLNAGLLMWGLGARGHFKPDTQITRAIPKMVVASAVMGGALWLAAYHLQPYLDRASGIITQLLTLSLLVATGAAVFFVLCHLTGAARLSQLLAAVRRGG